METGDYEKSKCARPNLAIDPVILEKAGLINECKWKVGSGTQDSPHVHEMYVVQFNVFLAEKRS